MEDDLMSKRHQATELQSMLSTQRGQNSTFAGRVLKANSQIPTRQTENLKIANHMNVNSHDIVSLFREMELAIRRVL